MTNLFKRFIKDENGATAIEYGLLAALISVVLIVAAGNVGNALSTVFNNINDALTGAVGG